MNQEVHFKNIRSAIIDNLDQCKFDLKIAVAWFTDKRILKKVNDLAKKNVRVSVIIYDDHVNKKELFKELYYHNAQIYLSKKLMHNKFCIVDNKTVINGSYNWTLNASGNDENITITSNDKNFAQKFISQFENLRNSCREINDFFEYSNEGLQKIQDTFELYFHNKIHYNFPYILNAKSIEWSEPNMYSSFPKTLFLVKNKAEERELLWFIFFLKSEHSLGTLSNLLTKPIKYPTQHFDHIVDLSFNKQNVAELTKNKYLVEEHNTRIKKYSVFFITKYGERIGDKIQYSHKLPSGLYLRNFWNAPSQFVDVTLKKFNINAISLKVHNEIGIICQRKINSRPKYGLLNFLGKSTIPFKFDYYNINEIKKTVEFIEFPIYRTDLEEGEIQPIYVDHKNYDNYTYKVTFYKYQSSKIAVKPVIRNASNQKSEKFIFKSDSDYDKHFKDYEYQNLYEEEKRKMAIQAAEDRKKEGCYIATMVYNDYDHEDVLILRRFRDNFLEKYVLGKKFIDFYYTYSPKYVEFAKNREIIQCISKYIIYYLVGQIKNKMKLNWPEI